MDDREICLNCAHWLPLGDAVGACSHYGLRLQFDGTRYERICGVPIQMDCRRYKFLTHRTPWKERYHPAEELERQRKEADAVYEQMRYERRKEKPKAYWQMVRDERKQRLNMMVGGAA